MFLCLGCGGVGGVGLCGLCWGEWVGSLGHVLGRRGRVMTMCIVSLDYLFISQIHVSVYCARRIPAHLRCTQCSILLHLIGIYFLQEHIVNYPKLKINDHVIERVQSFNFLGLLVHYNMTRSKHIE